MDWSLAPLVAALVIGFGLGRYTRKPRTPKSETQSEPRPAAQDARGQSTTAETQGIGDADLFGIAKSLEDALQQTAHPKDSFRLEGFERGVSLLCDTVYSTTDVLVYLRGENWIISGMAGEALCRRSADKNVSAPVLAHLPYFGAWPMYFALKYLALRSSGPLIGAVLVQAQEWWSDTRSMVQVMAEFSGERLAKGEVPTFSGKLAESSDEEISHVSAFLTALGMEALKPLRKEISDWQRLRVDVAALNAVGRVWTSVDDGTLVEHPRLVHYLAETEKGLREPPYRSIVLVGSSGVGKTALVRLLATQLKRRGWTLFEAGAADVLAGQVYIGELEGRIKTLLANLAPARRVLWYAPSFHHFLHAGSHRNDPTGILDLILPAIESRQVVIVGETTPEGYNRIV